MRNHALGPVAGEHGLGGDHLSQGEIGRGRFTPETHGENGNTLIAHPGCEIPRANLRRCAARRSKAPARCRRPRVRWHRWSGPPRLVRLASACPGKWAGRSPETSAPPSRRHQTRSAFVAAKQEQLDIVLFRELADHGIGGIEQRFLRRGKRKRFEFATLSFSRSA